MTMSYEKRNSCTRETAKMDISCLIFLTEITLMFRTVKSFKFKNMQPDYYSYLHVTRYASQIEIKSSYRKISKLLHPDKNKCDSDSTEKFILLKEAYDILSNENKRTVYDINNPNAGFQGKIHDWDIPSCQAEKENSQTFLEPIGRWMDSLQIWFDPNKVEINYDRVLLGFVIITCADIIKKFPVIRLCLLFVILLNIYHFFIIVFLSQIIRTLKQVSISNRVVLILGMWAVYVKLIVEDHTHLLQTYCGTVIDIFSIVMSTAMSYSISCHSNNVILKIVGAFIYMYGTYVIFLSVNFKVTGVFLSLLCLLLYFILPWCLTWFLLDFIRLSLVLLEHLRKFTISTFCFVLLIFKHISYFNFIVSILLFCLLLKYIKHIM